MPNFIDIEAFVKDQTLLHQDRKNSQYATRMNSTPTFVTYFNIDMKKSTVTPGLGTVDMYLGPDSPVRYNKINGLPIYDIPQVGIEVVYDDIKGTSSEYTGNGKVLPGTITPCPGDVFIIEHVHAKLILMVDNSTENSLKPNTYHLISFHLIDPAKIAYLDGLVNTESTIIFDKIGTNETALLINSDKEKLDILTSYYTAFAENYIYKHSSVLSIYMDEADGKKYLDKYLLLFMKKNNILHFDNILNLSRIIDYVGTGAEILEYKASVYSKLENKKDITVTKPQTMYEIIDPVSAFKLYYSTKIYNVTNSTGIYLSVGDYSPLTDVVINKLKVESKNLTDPFAIIIDAYLKDIEITFPMIDNIIALDSNNYQLIPIVLYIIKSCINRITNKKI
jgi:hypothetical protein